MLLKKLYCAPDGVSIPKLDTNTDGGGILAMLEDQLLLTSAHCP
jgi:hypothetical protein